MLTALFKLILTMCLGKNFEDSYASNSKEDKNFKLKVNIKFLN